MYNRNPSQNEHCLLIQFRGGLSFNKTYNSEQFAMSAAKDLASLDLPDLDIVVYQSISPAGKVIVNRTIKQK